MNKSKSIRTLQSFSPGWSDQEILEKTLVGRRDLVDRLEELAIDGAGGPNKHQRLIIGFRGSGKTHVLRVIHNRLWSDEELKKRLLIIYLLEDELGVASFLDFVVRLLRAILRWYPAQKEIAQGLEEIYDLPPDRQETRAVQLLLRASGTRDILIIMENLGITFDNVKGFGLEGQQALRDLVQHHPRFMIFASSQALAESIKDANAPFYGFFKIIHLRRLTLDEAMAFLMAMASAYGNQDVVSFLNTPQGRGRMRAIYEFTGGNHRLLVVFYEFLTSDSVAKLSDLFIQALDPLKPFYQEQMRSLSAQQQKIIQFLSLQRSPCTVKEIARACLAAPNTVSSQLKDLLDKNFVDRIGQGRESYYEIAEALFRICHEAELEQEGAPVRLFVDFLGNLYTGKELQLRYRGFSLLANRLGAEGHIPFAEEAEAMHRKALELEPGNADAWAILSGMLEKLGRLDDAAAAFQEAERHGADRLNLLNSRGEARRERGEYMLAISDYEEALQADPQAVLPHFNIVSSLLALGRIEDALARLSSAIESDRASKTPCSNYVTQSFFENCVSLFEHAPTASFDRYLTAALDIIGSDDPAYLRRFEESLPLTIFALLEDQENISELRLSRILESFQDVIKKWMEASVAVRFLKTGIDHFKKKDKKALLRLTKEERSVFCKVLNIV